MLTGDEVLAARTRAGLTQQQLGDMIGVTLRSVGNWERAERVPRAAEQRLRAALAAYLDVDAPAGASLDEVSDARLLAEIARRFDRGREDVGNDVRSASIDGAGDAPADQEGAPVAHRKMRVKQPKDVERVSPAKSRPRSNG